MATFTPPEALDEEEAWSPPEAWEPPEALEQEPEQQSRLSSGLSEAGRSFSKVFTGTAAGIPRLMDSPLTPSGLVNMGARAIMGAVSPEYKFALGMPKEKLDQIDPNLWPLLHPNEALAQQVERLNPEIDKLLPTNPAYEGEWGAQKIPSVLGQAAGQLTSLLVPGGIASKAAGVSAKALAPALTATGLAQANLLGRSAGLEEADRLGVTSPVKKAIMGELFGATEAGSEALFGFGTPSFSKALAGEIRDLLGGSALKTFAKTAVGEGLEEGAAQIPQDVISTAFRENEAPVNTIDPTRLDFWSNLGETMALGSIAGGLFGGVQALADRKTPTAALAMRTAVQEHTKSLEAKPDITPEEVGELEELRAYDQKLAEWLTQQGVDPAKQEEALMTASERFARADQNLTRLEEGVDKNRPSVPEQLQPIVEENLAAGNPKTAQALAGLTENLAIKREAEAAAEEAPVQEPTTQAEAQAVAPEALQPQPVVSDADAIQGPETLPLGRPPADSTTLRGPYPEGQEVTGEEIQGGTPATSGQVDPFTPPPLPQQSPTPVANEVVSKFARMATLAKNPQLAEEYTKAGSVLAPLVGSVRNAFSNIYFRPRLNTAFAVMGDGSLLVDADHIAKGLSDGTWTPESLHVAMNEEMTHLAVDNATARMLSKERGGEVTAEDVDAQHAKDWKMLPKRVRQESEWLYRLATIERARRAKGRELTEEEIEESVRAVQSSDAIRGAEFKRQVMQGRIFGVLTEEAQRRPDFAKWLTDFLNELLQSIKDIAKRVTDPIMLRKLDELERDVRLELEALKTGERAGTKGVETRTSPETVDLQVEQKTSEPEAVQDEDVEYTSFDAYGRLMDSRKSHKEGALKELRARKSVLESVSKCLGGKLT